MRKQGTIVKVVHVGESICCTWCCVTTHEVGDEIVLTDSGDGVHSEKVCAPCFNFSPDWVGLTAEEKRTLEPIIDLGVFEADTMRCFRCKKLGHRFIDCKQDNVVISNKSH